jgi:HlyD family secretion protein
VIEPSSLWVKVRLDQARSGGWRWACLLRSCCVRTRAAPLSGKVARVEATSDSVTEERVAQVASTRLPAGLSVGELAEVTLSLPATAPAVLLPNAAIKRQAQTGVWRIDGGKPCASRPCAWARPAWTARCRCSTA